MLKRCVVVLAAVAALFGVGGVASGQSASVCVSAFVSVDGEPVVDEATCVAG